MMSRGISQRRRHGSPHDDGLAAPSRFVRACCLTLALSLMLAGFPSSARASLAGELAATNAAPMTADPIAAQSAMGTSDDELSPSSGDAALREEPDAEATAAGTPRPEAEGSVPVAADEGDGPASAPLASVQAERPTAQTTGNRDVSNMSRTVAVSTAAPNVSKTVAVAAPPSGVETTHTVPRLWAWLYDTGDMVLSAADAPDSAYGNALGVWDASDTGTTWSTRPAWVSDKPDVVVRRVVVADDARLPAGAPTAAEALAQGDVPSSPAPHSIAWWFWGMSDLEVCEGIDALDTSLVVSAESAFEGCASMSSLDMSTWKDASLGLADASSSSADDSEDADRSDLQTATAAPASSQPSPEPTVASPTARMLAGCTALGRLALSGSFAIREAALPSATWQDANGESVASALLCSAEPSEVAGVWSRVDLPASAGSSIADGTADGAGTSGAPASLEDGAGSAGSDPALGAVPQAGPVVATLVRKASGTELLLSRTPADKDETKEAEVLGSWDVSDTGLSGVPWAGHAREIHAVRVLASVTPASMAGWFAGCSSLATLQGATLLDTSACRTMNSLFSGCSALGVLDLSAWDVSSCRDFGSVFTGCSSLVTLDLASWSTASALTMTNMFSGCTSLRHLTLGAGFAFASGCTLPAGTWTKRNAASTATRTSATAPATDGDVRTLAAMASDADDAHDKLAAADGRVDDATLSAVAPEPVSVDDASGNNASGELGGLASGEKDAASELPFDEVIDELVLSAADVASLSGGRLAGRWVRMRDVVGSPAALHATAPQVLAASSDVGNASVTVPLTVVAKVADDGDVSGRIRIVNESEVGVRLTSVSFLPASAAGGADVGSHVRMGNARATDAWVLATPVALSSLTTDRLTGSSIPSGEAITLDITGDVSDVAFGDSLRVGTISWMFELSDSAEH